MRFLIIWTLVILVLLSLVPQEGECYVIRWPKKWTNRLKRKLGIIKWKPKRRPRMAAYGNMDDIQEGFVNGVLCRPGDPLDYYPSCECKPNGRIYCKADRTLTSDVNAMGSEGKCVPGTFWNRDDCWNCYCVDDGLETCLRYCDEHSHSQPTLNI